MTAASCCAPESPQHPYRFAYQKTGLQAAYLRCRRRIKAKIQIVCQVCAIPYKIKSSPQSGRCFRFGHSLILLAVHNCAFDWPASHARDYLPPANGSLAPSNRLNWSFSLSTSLYLILYVCSYCCCIFLLCQHSTLCTKIPGFGM